MYKLIADGGATKTEWAVLGGESPLRFSTKGFNPSFVKGTELIEDILNGLPEEISQEEVEAVEYYGAGITPALEQPIAEMLAAVFYCAESIVASSDMLGAAKALLGDRPGFAAILGTGVNSCIYDGRDIVAKIPSFGFIMGDEGSGAYIGKCFLRDYIRGAQPAAVKAAADPVVNADYSGLVERIYRGQAPNAYCASFTRFIGEHYAEDPYYGALVRASFRDFFRNIVSLYKDYTEYEFNAVGSIADVFSEDLAAVAAEFGMKVGKIIKAPLDAIVEQEI